MISVEAVAYTPRVYFRTSRGRWRDGAAISRAAVTAALVLLQVPIPLAGPRATPTV